MAYGTTNGMGYHEYLQMCEDMGAEPIYVINSGITSQSRRPRYEDITAMDKLTGDALDAIAYANAPADSLPRPACEERASGTFQLEVCRDRQRELWRGVFQAL